jgi:alkylation response protein AidB-like acyl-CoA dehydrogenase
MEFPHGTTEERERVARALDRLLERFPEPARADRAAFLQAQYELGLAWVHFEPGAGGLGVPAGLQQLVTERLSPLDAPVPGSGDYVGVHQVAASIAAFGTPAQQSRFLPGIYTGSECWCQLFSEPGAGSDLAGLSTMALRDGDEWVITGQKTWTSGAHRARWAILLARSDPDVAKHRGLTFFVCDMTLPGVEVRPLRQADGGAQFSEVFLDGVRIPDELRIGAVGNGWAVALAGLHAEREGIGEILRSLWDEVAAAWKAFDASTPNVAEVMRQRVVASWIDTWIIDVSKRRMQAAQGRGGSTPLGSLLKIAQSRANQRAASLVTELMGPAGLVDVDYDAALKTGDDGELPPRMLVLRTRANSIEGGSDEIQRNIVGEQVLGLPGDVRVDKNVPWRDVPRS